MHKTYYKLKSCVIYCISFLRLHSKLPQTQQLKTPSTSYLTVWPVRKLSGPGGILCRAYQKAEVSWASLLSEGSGQEFASKLPQPVGRIPFLGHVGLRFHFLSGYLETTHIPRLTAPLLPSSKPIIIGAILLRLQISLTSFSVTSQRKCSSFKGLV